MTVASISRSSDLELLTRTREHFSEPAVDFTSFLAGLIQQPAHLDRSGVYNPPQGETGGQDGKARGGLQEPAGPEPAGIAGVPGRKAMGSPREADVRPTGPGDGYQASAGAKGTAGSGSGGQVTGRDAPAAAAGKGAPAGGKGAPRSGFQAGDGRRTAAAQDKAAAGGQVKGETSLAGKAVEAHQATSLLAVAAANVQDEAGAGAAGRGSRQPLRGNWPDLASRIEAVPGMGAAGKAAVIKGKGQVQGGLPAGVNPRETGTTGPGDPGSTTRGGTLAGEALKTGLALEGEGRQQAGAGKPVTDANSMEIADRSAGMPFIPDNRQVPMASGEGRPPVRGPVPGNSLLAGDYNPANTGPSNREPAGETLTSSGGSSPVGPAAFNAVMGGNSQQAGNQVAQINNLPQVFTTILSTARLAATNGRQELELQLQPENLGKLKLRALLDGGRLTLQLLVESSEAARALQAAVPEMRQAAAVQGLRLDQVQVQVNARAKVTAGSDSSRQVADQDAPAAAAGKGASGSGIIAWDDWRPATVRDKTATGEVEGAQKTASPPAGAVLIKGKGQVQGGLPAGINTRETGTTGPGTPGTTRQGGTLAGEALKTGLPLEGEGRQQAGAGKPVTDANSMEIADRSAGMPFVPDNRQAPPGSGEGKPPVRGPVSGNSLLAGDYNPANTGPSNRERAGETLASSGGSSPVGPAAFNAIMGGNGQQAGNQVAQINNLPEVFATILSTARLAATNGRQELELQLQPENLGKLRLRALLDGGRLTLQLLVESSEAARALQAAVPEMRQAAAVQGLHLDQVQVQVGGDGHGGGRHQADSQGEYRQGSGWRRQSPGWPVRPSNLEGTINRYRLDYLA